MTCLFSYLPMPQACPWSQESAFRPKQLAIAAFLGLLPAGLALFAWNLCRQGRHVSAALALGASAAGALAIPFAARMLPPVAIPLAWLAMLVSAAAMYHVASRFANEAADAEGPAERRKEMQPGAPSAHGRTATPADAMPTWIAAAAGLAFAGFYAALAACWIALR